MLSFELLVIVLCLAGNAFFAGIETGMISINRLKLRPHVEAGAPWALQLQNFLDTPSRLLGTTLLGTNLCMIMGSVLAASLGADLWPRFGDFIAGILMTVVVLVVCEYMPKAWFRAHPIARSRHFVAPLQMASRVLNPLIRVVTVLTDWIIRDPEGKVNRTPVMTRDDLLVLTQESTDNGLLTPRQRIMILRVADLSENTPSACMTPRAKMTVVPAAATVAEFYRKASETGLSTLPLLDETSGEFAGVAHLFDILPVEAPDSAVPVSRYMKPAPVVKFNTPLTELFPLMRRTRQPMCLVTGPKGEVVGLITPEDILRLIIGSL